MALVYWLLLYDLVPDYIERRPQFREEHLALATSYRRRGFLVLAGAFDEPVDGAALVFRADDRAVVEHFVDDDPYVHNGLVTSWRIRRWTVVIGGDAGPGEGGDTGIGQSRSGIW